VPERPIEELVAAMYPALAIGDAATIRELIDPGFVGEIAEGMPLGLGGLREGADEMLERGWWAIGRVFRVRAEPREWIPCADGRLLVRGRYLGSARSTGAALDAEFTHVWSAREGRLTRICQLTDTALWHAALDYEEDSE
jgi:ketosteroid isomerase-like protein